MKNPKSNFVTDARHVWQKRQVMHIIITIGVIAILLFIAFFLYMTLVKEEIDDKFSEDNVTETSTSGESDSSDPSGSTETAPSESESGPTEPVETSGTSGTDVSDPSTDPSSDPTSDPTTGQNLLPQEWDEGEDVILPQRYPLQTVSHSERDQAYSLLKQSVKDYIAAHPDSRIGFYYINLRSNEAFGFNETSPFVVGSAINMPFTMLLFDRVAQGTISLQRVYEYRSGDWPANFSSVIKDGAEGQQYTMRELIHYAVSDGDGIAMDMIFPSIGEENAVIREMSQISGYVDFGATQTYMDAFGQWQTGDHRSSAYDMATYAEALYLRYLSHPDDYQYLINDLGRCSSTWGIGSYFPDDAVILHRTGSNTNYSAECDVAIICSDEPVVVVVTCEAPSTEAGREHEAALGALVYNFLHFCHS